jgi:hypothetical protein
LTFAVSARDLYLEPYEQADEHEDLRWLVSAGWGYHALRDDNAANVRRMSRLSGAVAILMVVQALAWLGGLGLG